MSNVIDIEAALRRLHNYGLKRDDVELCGVSMFHDGRAVYYRCKQHGPMKAFTARPIAAAWHCVESLIGFLFPDGTLRDDAEMVMVGTDKVELPLYVVFYRDHVPMVERVRLASRTDRRVQKPISMVTLR